MEKPKASVPALEVKNLSMHFNSGRGKKKMLVKAIDDVSFHIDEAETFGLVGESGCGKTTMGRTILRIYNPTGGSILYNGREISGSMNRSLRKYLTDNIAMIFQDPVDSLNPRMTVEEIIREGLTVRGVGREEARERVFGILEKVGLTKEHASRYPHEFSGGQRQRIGIARAIVAEPRIIIADEPVSALDVSVQAQVINLLNELKQDMRLTIMFIAHNLSVVKYFSDRIGVMYYGKMVEVARGDDLYRNPLHPYTRALISAIPKLNPFIRKKNLQLTYDPYRDHNYTEEKPAMTEIEQGHFVYCSPSEAENYRQRLR